MTDVLIYYIFAPTIVTISNLAMYRQLQTTMKKYNIICTKTSLNGKEREEYIYSENIFHLNTKEIKSIYSEEEAKAKMIQLFLYKTDIMYVDEESLIEDMFYGGEDGSWFHGDGLYTFDTCEKIDFDPLTDSFEKEIREHIYTYRVKEIG